MLKLDDQTQHIVVIGPAAFRRLCVETDESAFALGTLANPAAFRRLCVETVSAYLVVTPPLQPAAFRRLCVETGTGTMGLHKSRSQPPSGGCVLKQEDGTALWPEKHPAAFRRLCVETDSQVDVYDIKEPSRLQAAVC